MARDRAVDFKERTDQGEASISPQSMKRILVALDASDHASRALTESVRLAGLCEGSITGIHAYAAALHDQRFRQMEGGLPERYRQEDEMRHQRDVHDDLITRGLNIISDSYHDAAQIACDEAEVAFYRLSPEGKNYRRIVEAAETGDFDVLALGSIGLGAMPGSLIGTVCERTVRRSPIDTLIIRDPAMAIGDGPIVAAIDGSTKSFGALRTAISLARMTGAEVHAVAAYDPYYHYVAFNKIAKGLSEEAGQVFRFKEQEQLHEELIDDGIAKIYQSHLNVAKTVAQEEGVDLRCELVAGKPYLAIAKYLKEAGASIVVAGKTGIHVDEKLDIGGVAENLLRAAPCHVWLGQAEYAPPFDTVAEETVMWSDEAESMLGRAPGFVQGMARKAVQRHALETGHTFVTSEIVEEVMRKMMPGASGETKAAEKLESPDWDEGARLMLDAISDAEGREGIALRAEKAARRDGAAKVLAAHVAPFVGEAKREERQATSGRDLPWRAAALARLAVVPEFVRDTCREKVIKLALARGVKEINVELTEEGISEIRKNMCPAPEGGDAKKGGGEGGGE